MRAVTPEEAARTERGSPRKIQVGRTEPVGASHTPPSPHRAAVHFSVRGLSRAAGLRPDRFRSQFELGADGCLLLSAVCAHPVASSAARAAECGRSSGEKAGPRPTIRSPLFQVAGRRSSVSGLTVPAGASLALSVAERVLPEAPSRYHAELTGAVKYTVPVGASALYADGPAAPVSRCCLRAAHAVAIRRPVLPSVWLLSAIRSGQQPCPLPPLLIP
jgi:hypothetical protein